MAIRNEAKQVQTPESSAEVPTPKRTPSHFVDEFIPFESKKVEESAKGNGKEVVSQGSPNSGIKRKLEPRVQAPWVKEFYAKKFPKKPLYALHEEILDFAQFISPTPEEHEKREQLYQRFVQLVKGLWPNATVESFGSFATKLYLPMRFGFVVMVMVMVMEGFG